MLAFSFATVILRITNRHDAPGGYRGIGTGHKYGRIGLRKDLIEKALVPGEKPETEVQGTTTPALVNEFSHAYDDLIKKGDVDMGTTTNASGEVVENYEIASNNLENQMRDKLGQSKRQEDSHSGRMTYNSKTARLTEKIGNLKDGSKKDRLQKRLDKEFINETEKK